MRRLTPTRLVATLAGLLALLVAIVLVVLSLDLRFGDGAMLHLLSPWSDNPTDATILWQVRLPRVVAGAVIGAGLASAGCAFQAVLRNPLADPFTLGIASGSSLAAVIAIRIGIHHWLGDAGIGLFAVFGFRSHRVRRLAPGPSRSRAAAGDPAPRWHHRGDVVFRGVDAGHVHGGLCRSLSDRPLDDGRPLRDRLASAGDIVIRDPSWLLGLVAGST